MYGRQQDTAAAPLREPQEHHHLTQTIVFISSGVSGLMVLVKNGHTEYVLVVDLSAALSLPPWTGRLFASAGLVLLVIGLMAWLGTLSVNSRTWGRRTAFSGAALVVVGTSFESFLGVIRYVLG